MILTAFIHMFSVVFLHAYRRPRELTWLSGIALLGLALAFGFSGYLLPWNKVSYFATKVGTDMAAAVPLVGEHIARFLRGGNDVGGGTLTRFGFHVAVLPGSMALLLLVHLGLVQRHGMSSPPWIKGVILPQMKFFPNFFLRELMAWYAALGVLGSLAALFPWELGEKADPFASAPAGIRPEWYFLAPFYTLKAHSQPCVEDRRRTARPARLWPAGGSGGWPALLGVTRDGWAAPLATGAGVLCWPTWPRSLH
jgi:cytochrome b6